MVPARALPVPFCFQGLRPPPATAERFFWALVPARAPARYETTTWWTSGSENGLSNTVSLTVILLLPPVIASSMLIFLLLRLDRRTHQHMAARCACHRAANEQQVAFGVYPYDFEILGGDALGAHVAGHLLALEHASGRLALANGTRRTMRQRVAVRGVLHPEIMALDDAGKTLALAGAGHVDHLTVREAFDRDFAADFELAFFTLVFSVEAEFPQTLTRLDAGGAVVTSRGLVDQRRTARARRDLDGCIAIAVKLANLGDPVRIRLHHRDGHGRAVLDEDAGHPSFSSYDTNCHDCSILAQYSLIWTSTPAARSSFISASTVLSLGSTMSISRLWVRISYWSRASLLTCGETRTVYRSFRVGSGMGPRTWAPVRFAVSTISCVERSIKR